MVTTEWIEVFILRKWIMNSLITELIQVCRESSYMPADALLTWMEIILKTFDFSCLKKILRMERQIMSVKYRLNPVTMKTPQYTVFLYPFVMLIVFTCTALCLSYQHRLYYLGVIWNNPDPCKPFTCIQILHVPRDWASSGISSGCCSVHNLIQLFSEPALLLSSPLAHSVSVLSSGLHTYSSTHLKSHRASPGCSCTLSDYLWNLIVDLDQALPICGHCPCCSKQKKEKKKSPPMLS